MKNNLQTTPPPSETVFHSECQILPRLGVSRRTLKNWRDRGLIPYCKLPGTRLVKYHWPSVEKAILRMQRNAGGEQ